MRPFPAPKAAVLHDPVEHFGQVFTAPAVVQQMLALRRNTGRVLEPSCGNGA
ncbi:class I SAM-dependent methyltransferase, partial [Uliginosibacterium paludis]